MLGGLINTQADIQTYMVV